MFEKNETSLHGNFLGKRVLKKNIHSQVLIHLFGERRELLCNQISSENEPDNNE